jgi:hypothetical protein
MKKHKVDEGCTGEYRAQANEILECMAAREGKRMSDVGGGNWRRCGTTEAAATAVSCSPCMAASLATGDWARVAWRIKRIGGVVSPGL